MRNIVVSLLQHDGRFTTTNQFLERNWAFFTASQNKAPYVIRDLDNSDSTLMALHTVATALISLVSQSHWTFETHRANMDSIPNGAFKRELHHYLRWILLEGASGLSISQVLVILGRKESLRRLSRATIR